MKESVLEKIFYFIMWIIWILLLCATDSSTGASLEPQSVSVHSLPPFHEDKNHGSVEFQGIRRFACPVGFFRLKRNCYYLSAGIAPWREAHFHCKDRNATLAVLDKHPKDRILRKYLMGEQFTKLERWIGGVYNWQQMAWEWGVSGDKVKFQNFFDLHQGDPKQYAWHCIVLDPFAKYKWSPRSCIEKKHYICEVPAGRIGRRRKKKIDPNLIPQNQRQRQKRKRGKKYRKDHNEVDNERRNGVRGGWKRKWAQHANQEWAHGVNLGSRAPSHRLNNTKTGNRARHRPNRVRIHDNTPKIMQIVPQGHEYGAFLGDGPVDTRPKSLSDDKTLSQYHAKINDLSLEEVLLKT